MRWMKEDEVKENFPELLEEVVKGETVVIMRGSLKIAKIVPDDERSLLEISEEKVRQQREAHERLQESRRKRRESPDFIPTTIEEILEWRRGDPFKKEEQAAQLVPSENKSLAEDAEETKKRNREAVDTFLEWRGARKPRGITLEEALEWRHAKE